jgi:DNA-binding transcriptional ArsR family regulator
MLETFAALAEPNRLRVVELLRQGPRAVGEISERLDVRQPQVSKHLKVLSDAGLVAMRTDAQRRIYRLRSEPLQELDRWLDGYRAFWERNFDALDDVLDEMKTKERRAPARRGKRRTKS